MKLVPLSSGVWQQFSSWHMQPPAPWRNGIFVADDAGSTLLGGIRYVETPEFVLFSNVTVNQTLPEPERYKVFRYLLLSAARYCTCRSMQGALAGQLVDGFRQVPLCLLPQDPDLPANAPRVQPDEPGPRGAAEVPEAPREKIPGPPPPDELPDDVGDLVAAVRVRKERKNARRRAG